MKSTIKPLHTLTALLSAIADGASPKYTVFFGSSPGRKYSGFGQSFASPFKVDGIEYLTAKHWMMAEKARIFNDTETLAEILSAPPENLTEIGRRVRCFNQEVWDSFKLSIVVTGNTHKFRAHPDLKELLLATDGDILVNAAVHDPAWGVGISEQHVDILNPVEWRGDNLLGFALMQVREALQVPLDI